ncbi:MAG: hypothetical protein AVDCRST_MAG08-3839 [uncultured Acetobacteraceae bacterium]|uniref:Uncharacterized protein n=1 Tax=uncultured Acetobacteraceae bacterium TaxID=169975 RepID=A0A6J4JKK2_9PROT|nr:MAG: hypothetical protein AVDCRST_MAG08-3839 [uncultured Acetobacteraceae bacterium]
MVARASPLSLASRKTPGRRTHAPQACLDRRRLPSGRRSVRPSSEGADHPDHHRDQFRLRLRRRHRGPAARHRVHAYARHAGGGEERVGRGRHHRGQ